MKFLIIVIFLLSACGKNTEIKDHRKSVFVLQVNDGYYEHNENDFKITNPKCEFSATRQGCIDSALLKGLSGPKFDFCMIDLNIESSYLNEFIIKKCNEIE